MKLHAPQPLTADHQIDAFKCGETSLDEWLKRRALLNQTNGASRTFVVVDENHTVMGYYALAAGAVHHQDAPRSIRQNMPDPLPVMVLARLAVDLRAQGMQLGAGLLRDAVERSLAVAQNAGVRALLVHALHERAKQFYLYFGFQASPVHPLTLMLRLKS
jgi:GNAT superfamily N-acetyltransferase